MYNKPLTILSDTVWLVSLAVIALAIPIGIKLYDHGKTVGYRESHVQAVQQAKRDKQAYITHANTMSSDSYLIGCENTLHDGGQVTGIDTATDAMLDVIYTYCKMSADSYALSVD